MKIHNKLIIGATLTLALVNPLVGSFVIQGIIKVYEMLSVDYVDYVQLVAITALLISLVILNSDKRKEYNYKFNRLKKSKTQKAGKFISDIN